MGVLDVVLGIAVLGLLIYRQLRTRRVRASVRVPVVLAVIGVIQAENTLKTVHDTNAVVAGLAGSLGLALVFGVARAMTVRLSFREGQWWQQGTWLTALLWLAAVAAHFGYDALLGSNGARISAATIVLYLAVTFGAQWAVVQFRSQRQPALGAEPASRMQV